MRKSLQFGLMTGCLAACTAARCEQVTWRLDNLESLGGHRVTVVGEPQIVDTALGAAVEFDGIDDGIFLDVNPLAAMTSFTVEIILKPYSGGALEQRFFHMQEDPSEERVMFETRLTEDGEWFLDTFIYSGEQKITHYADTHLHALDDWQHAAIVVDGDSFSHFVNGTLEEVEPIQFESLGPGRTSLGVRLNRVHWFKGAIHSTRFTDRPLNPDEFLRVPN